MLFSTLKLAFKVKCIWETAHLQMHIDFYNDF